MYNKTLHEILSTRFWFFMEHAFVNYYEVVSRNMMGHVLREDLDIKSKNEDYNMYWCKDGRVVVMPVGASVTDEDGNRRNDVPAEDDPYTLVLNIKGPITRNGDLCTYGSIEHRDMLLVAAKDDHCQGVAFFIDSPGGSAFSVNDYRQGLDAIKAAGKRSASFVDGMCGSCAVAVAVQTDYTVCMNGADLYGCIGAMILAQVPIHGKVNSDGERYIVLTAGQTPDKNKAIRDAADGNYELLQEEVNDYGQQFIDLVKEMRPQITPDQMTGKVYRADNVIGTMVDGIGTFDDVINYIMTGQMELQVPASSGAPATPAEPEEPSVPAEPEPKPQNSVNKMKIDNILAALHLEELPVQDGGIFLNESLAEQLNEFLATAAAPAEPSAETEPAAPAEPEAPENPESPEEPETPAAPAEPSAGTEPAAPAEPEASENPESPEEPETPAAPAEPESPEEPEAPAEPAAPAEPSVESQYEERIRLMQEQHDRELTALHKQIEELSAATVPAPKPANKGAKAAAAVGNAAPKDYRNMTLEEKKAYWDRLGKK